jgi:galactonate dehydratase
MKIARIETFILGTGSSKDLLLCRVETEDGTHGWGEAYVTHGREEVIAVLIDKMAAHVIGRAVFQIRHTGQIMFDGAAVGVERDRDRLVGHYRQGRRAAGLQPAGRRLA